MIDAATALPGLNCGLCGFRTCEEMATHLATHPDDLLRCIHLDGKASLRTAELAAARPSCASAASCAAAPACAGTPPRAVPKGGARPWTDTLGREFDFYLEHFPEDPGPREIILPHNPMITREMDLRKGDILIGRPLGMSCGCPITHCGVAMEVDHRTGVLTWCVTGPLNPRQQGYKDLGYYIAEGYEGLVRETRCDLRIGERHFFQPRMCMLQWRHSGLVNFLSRTGEGWQIRLEGLWIG